MGTTRIAMPMTLHTTRRLVSALLVIGVARCSSPDCDTFKDCVSCSNASSWWPDSNCNWCPIDSQCHAAVSLENPCSKSQRVSNSSKCSESDPPQQLHLAFAGSNGKAGMSVMWASLGNSKGSVNYGTSAEALDQTVTASAKQYLKDAGFHHSVSLDALAWNTQYFYRVGANETGWSPVSSFVTAPIDPASSFTVSIFGDLGYEDSERRPMVLPEVQGLVKNWTAQVTRDKLEAMKPDFDFVWHVGDLGYADDAFDTGLGFHYESVYDGWMNWMGSIMRSKPYMVSPGNHEAECHSPACVTSSKGKALSNFSAFNTRWRMPFKESGSRSNMWYSYDYGSAHFISINSETDFDGAPNDGYAYKVGGFGPNNEYLKWLEDDLKMAQAKRESGSGAIKWILAGGHRPIGELGQAHKDLFQKYGVDVYFAGHSHSYTRSKPVNGTHLVVVGGAGCDEMAQEPKQGFTAAQLASFTKLGETEQQGPWWIRGYSVPEGSEEYSTARYATGLLQVNQSALWWRLVDSEDGEILDQVSIKAKY